ncbi:DUF2142 domain-containing protein [Lactovum miscens]|uniref:Putative membrane protein n=1 Tax=Lactovum miscens TaxID=190387 RepID=A0A841C7Z1_9LACT|nr:DUF2142 domain-containing protein [Lactovum miscens]MBB5887671.1 putative membrane protein [Lactovum miscens]
MEKIKAEKVFLWIMLIWGLLATFVTPPLTTGDEGYHLSIAYNIFSSEHPSTMSMRPMRDLEFEAIGGNYDGDTSTFNKKSLVIQKINLQHDGVKLNLDNSDSSFGPIDLMHLPAAFGVLLARLVYPSVGVMDYGARIANLLFFVLSFYFLIKRRKYGKWILVMLFTVPFMQKVASPSYDVFSYIALATYSLNLFDLALVERFRDLKTSKILYSLFTVLLLIFSKKNYVFALFALPGLPLIYQPFLVSIEQLDKKVRSFLYLISGLAAAIIVYFLNGKFHLVHLFKVFFNNYIVGQFAYNATIWSVVPTTIPNFINILWFVALALVAVGEKGHVYKKWTAVNFALVYFINWLGIFTGFYLMKESLSSFADLSGRYLHPFMVFFIPLAQSFRKKVNLEINEKAISMIAILITIFVLALYLFITFYRGFILRVNPTWAYH